MSKSLIHIRTNILETPLMITRAKLQEILGVIGPRMEIELNDILLDPEPGLIGLKIGGSKLPAKSKNGVAVIPVHGTLVHRGNMNALSGLRSYQTIKADFDSALDNPDVSQIVLDIDSSGGEVAGAFDLVDYIYNARGKKPIIASVNEHAFSAAYAIASAADKVYLSRTAGVGSIGVVALHEDRSQKDAKEGIKYTAIYAGDKKVELNPHAPLTDDAKSAVQERVNKIYDLFVDTVARNNAIDAKVVRDTKAGIYMGQDAVDAGLADDIKTFDQVMSDLNSNGGINEMTMRGEKTMIEDLNAEILSLKEIRDNLQARNAELTKELADKDAETDQIILEAISEATQTAMESERERVKGILDAGIIAKMDVDRISQLICDGVTVEEAKDEFMEELEVESRVREMISTQTGLKDGVNPLIADAEKRAQAES